MTFSRTDGGGWKVIPTSEVAFFVANLRANLRLVDDADDLRYVGDVSTTETSLHHLTATGPIPYPSSAGGTGTYTSLDLFVTEDGTPVRAKAQYEATDPSGAVIRGDTALVYSRYGEAIQIDAPVP